MRHALALLLTLALPSGAAALPNASQWNAEVDPELHARMKAVSALIEAEKYELAIPQLVELTIESPQEADLFNYLGFAYRKTGDLVNSGAAYETALRLEPGHLQALEYQGELFLALDDPEAAEENLNRIKALCAWPCDESKPLADAITKWRASKTN